MCLMLWHLNSRGGGTGGRGFTIDLGKSGPSPVQSSPNKTGGSSSSSSKPTTAATALGGEGGAKFDLPPLVKTGKDGAAEIKMPALPLKANFKRKEKDVKVRPWIDIPRTAHHVP